MLPQITKAAVIGAGVMGAAIAAHLANVGIPVLLLDIVPTELTPDEAGRGLTLSSPQVRNRIAQNGIAAAMKANPAAFYRSADASLVSVGNLEDDLTRLRDCDWVIEAVVERLDVKQALMERLEPHIHPRAVVSTNTSGISVRKIVEGRSKQFREQFLGTHFFNPPRYMKLLELIPGPDTSPQLVTTLTAFAERTLGKGVVIAKDTPNFIANRVGTFGLMITLDAMRQFGLGVDEVDAITGPALGRPKSATFRTLDLVGLDTFVHVAKNVAEQTTDAEERDIFAIPAVVDEMLTRRWLGEKSGQGFFKREKSSQGATEIQALDLETLEYRPRRKLRSPTLDAAKSASGLAKKLQVMVNGTDAAGQLAWYVTKKTLLYTAWKQDEIADDIVSVDAAMRWGFNWELGPYEIWDTIGLRASIDRMRSEGEHIPPWIETMLAAGQTRLYQERPDGTPAFYTNSGEYRRTEERKENILLSRLKTTGKLIKGNSGASLVDIGDGVVCLEFHSVKQALGADVIQMVDYTVQEVSKNWDALVIGNQANNFCVGANVMLMLMEAQDENWDGLNQIIHQFQQSFYRLKYLPKPVVAAPFGYTLGGGAEAVFPADRIQADAETYIGLVEVGLGLIPGAGGNKEMLLRQMASVPDDVDERLDAFVRKTFETVALAKVSTSAKEAFDLGYFRPGDAITVNRNYLLYDAKQVALSMVRTGYLQRHPKPFPVVGESGAALLKIGVYGMKESGYISDHDVKVAHQLIHVMTGGSLCRGTLVTEEYMLDLEREAFLSLVGEPKTQARMQHMLTTGKPLRN